MKEQYYGTGRRKEAVARVFLRAGNGRIIVNGKDFQTYFRGILAAVQALEPLKATNTAGRYDALITVAGGGPSGQADAIKLGVARALLKLDPDFRPTLKQGGYLKRDARVVERKKYGLHKARRAPQYSKR
ncbi:MAG: 30S ribosomal protein S9 [Trueperaceae bacterium]|jgi:small subunit ribosomal protein S9|nr:30S ribosomal protein S9 [Trueperaceae bacterium]|tara:strand:+ start:14116 stop:14505 length:390 start_codon:yes stop_codon:yes gene_type:complete